MTAYERPSLFINGELRDTAEHADDTLMNPATGVQLAPVPIASERDIADAIAAATRALPVWSATAPAARARVLAKAGQLIRDRAEALAHTLTLENGKTLPEARGEIGAAADILDWFSGEARRGYGRIIPAAPEVRMLALKEPVGVVAALSPWNFPVVVSLKKIAAALAAGCTVVAKPAEETPGAVLGVVQILHESGLPAGALNMLLGRPPQISGQLIAASEIAKISFTGSTAVGRQLAVLAGEKLKRLTMELGGHAPVIVMDDIDLDPALDLAVAGKFRNAGQVCTSATRFFVHHKVYDAFVGGFADRARKLRVGSGLEPQSQMGPLSNRRRIQALERLVGEAVSAGAKVAAGGARIDGQGYFFAPTVLADVPATATVMTEEPFGPLALMRPFKEIDQAIEAANAIPYGLASYALTRSSANVQRIVRGLRSGVVGVNTFIASAPETPFGGIKDSGYGVEGGIEGMDAYLVTKFVHEHTMGPR